MIWKVKKEIHQQMIYAESQEIVAIICKKQGDYIIFDKQRQPLYRVLEKTPVSMRILGNREGNAVIMLSESQTLTRPPRAEQLILTLDNLKFLIQQSEKRSYTILREQKTVGMITGILKCTATIRLDDAKTFEMAALFYALALRMLHEDDIEIV